MVILMAKGPIKANYGPIGWKGLSVIIMYYVWFMT